MNLKIENPATVASGEPGHAKTHELILQQSIKKSISINRRKSIRLHCLECSAFSPKEVRECHIDNCPLFPFRMGVGKQDPKQRDRSIKRYCLECGGGSRHEVSLCAGGDCKLYPYRNTSKNKSKPQKTPYTAIPSDLETNLIPKCSQAVDHEQKIL